MDEHEHYLTPNEMDLLRRGRIIDAIKSVRERTDLNLKAAKRIVDRYRQPIGTDGSDKPGMMRDSVLLLEALREVAEGYARAERISADRIRLALEKVADAFEEKLGLKRNEGPCTKPRRCESCNDELPPEKRRLRCLNCGLLVGSCCRIHGHNKQGQPVLCRSCKPE